MVLGDLHQSIINDGAGHILTAPSIELADDRAVTNHSMLVLHDSATNRWYIERLSANRWLLKRTPAGWQVEERVNRLLNGSDEARQLLA